MRYLKTIWLILILLLLTLPWAQQQLALVQEKPLIGFFKLQPRPEWKFFTWHRWFSGEFQEAFESRLEDHIGFRPSLFRVQNEYDYRLFGIGHAEGFVRGKNGVMFEEDYIHEYTGEYFIGETPIRVKMEKLKAVQQQLDSMGTAFVLVFEPGKAGFAPENIPERFFWRETGTTNYEIYVKEASRLDLPVINLQEYFLLMKDTSRYPLYPQYGMHWSIYGASLAMDTLKRYIEKVRNIRLPEMVVEEIRVSDSLRWTDKDIADLLNLIFPLQASEMAYPKISFDTTQAPPGLSVLVVADSYYINLINDYTPHLYDYQEFWYYNNKLYPHIGDDREPVYVDKSDLKNKLTTFDVVMLMVSEINLHCGFWNFADEAYKAFYPDHQDPPWYAYENQIRNERIWFRYMVEKAKNNHTTLENAIKRDAKFLYKTENH